MEKAINNEEFMALLEKNRVRLGDEFTEADNLLCVEDENGNDVGFLPSKSILTIIAAPKDGKTHFAYLFAVAAITGRCLKVKAKEKGMKVAIIDTEQRAQDIVNSMRQVIQMSGADDSAFTDENLFMSKCRSISNRVKYIGDVLTSFKPNIAIIDVGQKLVNDYNNQTEVKFLFDNLTKLAETHDCAFIITVHTTKSSNYKNSLGTFGSEADRLSELILVSEKTGNIFTLSTERSRHEDFPAISFAFDSDGNMVDAADLVRIEQEKAEEKRLADEKTKLDAKHAQVVEYVSSQTGPVTRNDVNKYYKDELGKSDHWGYTVVKDAINDGYLIYDESTGYLSTVSK